MAEYSKIPIYNLQVVLRETGIKPDTLRAWERRYGLPMPVRTQGGHRLYSQHDIETIKWLIARQDEGMRINRAVEMWRSLVSAGKQPLEDKPTFETTPIKVIPEPVAGANMDELRKKWISASMAYDELNAEHILSQAFATYPIETVCIEILAKGLSEIGSLWYNGKSSVQQEHFASSLVMRKLDSLISSTPPHTRNEKVLIGCPPDEEHVISPLMINLLLRRRGFDVIYLGANVPLEQFDLTIRATNPSLILMTATMLHTAATLLQAAQYLFRHQILIVFGGKIFNQHPDLIERIAGHYLGDNLAYVGDSVERILSLPKRLVHVQQIPRPFIEAHNHFADILPQLEAYLWESIKKNGFKREFVEIVNEFMSKDIRAALSLGDLNLLNVELYWLQSLIENHNIQPEYLKDYLSQYRSGVKNYMDQGGSLILEWFDQYEDVSR